MYKPEKMRFGTFLAPFHSTRDNPTLAIRRDMQLCQLMDELGYDEAWIGEHHSAGYEIISSPELFIAEAAARTKRLRFGTGVNSLTYHHPLILAGRLMQLDHQTEGRIMFGSGPGQLPTDAAMMGIKSEDQRRMMFESLECLVDLFEGKMVNRETDWFQLRDARVQLMPYQRPRMEMVQACAITPTGPVAAGRLGLGMLSLAASTKAGFTALGQHWDVYEAEAKKYNKPIHRDTWRVVVSMHIAETREQAYKDYEWGMLDLIRYSRRISGSYSDKLSIAKVKTAADGVELITTEGMGIFGVAMLGTPDDAIAHIEKLQEQSGGFGTFLFLQNNCPSFDSIKKSYELFARYVIPHFHGSNVNREASIDWATEHHKETYGGIGRASKAALEQHGAIDKVVKAGE